eukprot:7515338-Pyramimonas_sp.AAC.1
MGWWFVCASSCASRAVCFSKPCWVRPPLGSPRHYKRWYLCQGKGPSGEKVGNGSTWPVPIFVRVVR